MCKPTKNELSNLREQIDAIDERILDFLTKRAKVASKICEIKVQKNLPVFSPEREEEVLAHIYALNQGPLDNAALERIFKLIIQEIKISELKK